MRKIFRNGFPTIIKRYDEVTSTNDLAMEYLFEKGKEADGAVFIAEYQKKGRGREEREWFSKKGENLLFSFIFIPEEDYPVTLIPFAIGLSVIFTIESLFKIDSKMKWPNDIYIKGKKIGGILVESKSVGSKIIGLIAGVGININSKVEEFPVFLQNKVLTLKDVMKMDVDREYFFQTLLKEIPFFIEMALEKKNDFLTILRKSMVHKKGDLLKVSTGGEIFECRYQSIGEEGELIVKNERGKILKIIGGEVVENF